MLFFIAVLLILPLAALKIYSILVNARCKSNVCLIGKTALVTGGNSGMGYQIVLALASRGCRVIIADKVQDSDLNEKMFKETNSTNIVYQYVDLASFKSVREFANSLIKSEEKLDILVHNAGLARTTSFITEDGLDLTMQVNYFSPFLLTHLLVELLKKSPSGRVIFTSSGTAYFFDFTLENLKPTEADKETNSLSYAHSKYGLIVIADLFAQKLKKYKITSNSCHPGLVSTGIFKETLNQSRKAMNMSSLAANMLQLGAILFGKTPEEGAQTAIHLACANEVKDVTGTFFYETKPTFKPRKAYDEKFCNALWKASEEMVKLEPHEILL